jgi:methyl-accepting chemotaxis protein
MNMSEITKITEQFDRKKMVVGLVMTGPLALAFAGAGEQVLQRILKGDQGLLAILSLVVSVVCFLVNVTAFVMFARKNIQSAAKVAVIGNMVALGVGQAINDASLDLLIGLSIGLTCSEISCAVLPPKQISRGLLASIIGAALVMGYDYILPWKSGYMMWEGKLVTVGLLGVMILLSVILIIRSFVSYPVHAKLLVIASGMTLFAGAGLFLPVYFRLQDRTIFSVNAAHSIEAEMVIGICAVLILTSLFSQMIAGTITGPLQKVTRAAQKIGEGEFAGLKQTSFQEVCLSEQLAQVETQSQDEISQLAGVFNHMVSYQLEMVNLADNLSHGNLLVEPNPRSERDELGNALKRMVLSLRSAVGEVANNAKALERESSELRNASNQAGLVTNQIATTMSQIATGASQQADSITRTTASAAQFTQAIQGVALGAQEQAKAVTQASTLMGQLSKTAEGIRNGTESQTKQIDQAQEARQGMVKAIGAVSGAAQVVAQENKQTAQSAAEGRSMVGQASQGMEQVREATEDLGKRVSDLGKRSGQIGAIVETIDDIASQTNLLALNAAIEAARAGEHGKGFAVVADEVRKLAERSAVATREIGEMIRGIQSGAAETVSAMQRAGQDVSKAVELTGRVREAFEGIARGTQSSSEKSEAIQKALGEMQAAANQLEKAVNLAAEVAQGNLTASVSMSALNDKMVESLDGVSAVVEENTAATDLMASNSNEFTQAIENIASVSEENSAAVEEVTASTEEMSAQVQEVASSAHQLADMALRLQKVVQQFKI